MFENVKVPVPKGYEKSLEVAYGDDYMTMKQIPAIHRALKFNAEISYRKYIANKEEFK